MKNKNLIKMKEQLNMVNGGIFFGRLLGGKNHSTLVDFKNQINDLDQLIFNFNELFSDRGWCAYENLSIELMRTAIDECKVNGIDGGEKCLIEYFKNDIKIIIDWIKNSSDAFRKRSTLIDKFFEEHFSENYYSSVLLGLTILDGAVNDFTKSKGLFAEKTDIDAWDSIVGCNNGLKKVIDIFRKNRTVTNTDVITMPYRNGILHGRDLNYANEYVGCKCVSLMFAIACWMQLKASEDERKRKYQEDKKQSFIESCKKLAETNAISKEIDMWKPKLIKIGETVPVNGNREDYKEISALYHIVGMLEAWKNKNYGELAIYLKKLFPYNSSDKQNAGKCRKLLQNKQLKKFEILEYEEIKCVNCVVKIKVYLLHSNNTGVLKFRCFYDRDDNRLAVPWRNNGEWKIYPIDVGFLYTVDEF